MVSSILSAGIGVCAGAGDTNPIIAMLGVAVGTYDGDTFEGGN